MGYNKGKKQEREKIHISYNFSKEQIEELKIAKKKNKNKNVDKRFTPLLLRVEGKNREETAKVYRIQNC